MSNLEKAKRILKENESVLYGIFGSVAVWDVFPPQDVLNEFLARGHDPCDQDGRQARWESFGVSPEEYVQLLLWWKIDHPDAVENRLGANCWDDWEMEMLDGDKINRD